MYVARVLYPVEVLGPGKRVGIWFCGCPRRCKGCSNPELWEYQQRYKVSPKAIFQLVQAIAVDNEISGFTITGGDPMYQKEALSELIGFLQQVSDDILVYTGYLFEEIEKEYLSGVTVLIDGEYIEEKNDSALLRGSSNQRILILNEKHRMKYENYLATTTNQIQNFVTHDGIISVGIHRPDYMK